MPSGLRVAVPFTTACRGRQLHRPRHHRNEQLRLPNQLARSAVFNACASRGVTDHVHAVSAGKLARSVTSVALSFLLSTLPANAADYTQLRQDAPVADTAKIIATENRDRLADKINDFEQRTGYKLRVYTGVTGDTRVSRYDVRSNWSPDSRMLILTFDPSSPNIMEYSYVGDDVLLFLRRPFLIELQTRFGNMFYVRDEGEQASIMNSTDVLMSCMSKPEGCVHVPGLPMEHYWFTLVLSIAGGIVFGFAGRLQPAGFVQRRWIWLLVFSPLWASLFISYGIGPIVARTNDVWPVAANTAAFFCAAALFRPAPFFPAEDEA